MLHLLLLPPLLLLWILLLLESFLRLLRDLLLPRPWILPRLLPHLDRSLRLLDLLLPPWDFRPVNHLLRLLPL